jgi:hypothetical protein
MPEHPGDPPQRARVLTDAERAEAVQLRQIAGRAPRLPALTPPFPSEPPWSTGLAELAGLGRPANAGLADRGIKGSRLNAETSLALQTWQNRNGL